ncbi:hypothetical protein ES703_106532 [subsurface metagenome]|jgi:hypothetical protein
MRYKQYYYKEYWVSPIVIKIFKGENRRASPISSESKFQYYKHKDGNHGKK